MQPIRNFSFVDCNVASVFNTTYNQDMCALDSLKKLCNSKINQGEWGPSTTPAQLRWHILPCVIVTCHVIVGKWHATLDPGTIVKVTYHQKALNSGAILSQNKGEWGPPTRFDDSMLLSFHYHERAFLQCRDKLPMYTCISRLFMFFSWGRKLIRVSMVL